ncbi:MAG: enoyl-CoA hydratase-related protein, partial [Actinobacteria bacterium]|nr:enoyl-CoA hydratase-related protein [Actinomycetota bacterium]
FVAGADIAEMKDKSVLEAQSFAAFGQGVFADIENLEKPVIAAVNGYALGGGCELAMACDIRLASERSKLGQPEVSLGVTPGWGGTQRLARLVGRGKAKQLLFTGDTVDARTALAIGLVDEVYAPEELLPKAREMAQRIASRGQIAVRLAKLAVNRGLDMVLPDGVAFEAEIFGRCFATEDQKEGMGAFLEKRRPEFNGK